MVTTGSSGGFLLAFLAAFEVGDRVAMARPGYPCYRNVLTALGIEVVEIPTGPETRFQPTVEQVAALHEAQPITGLVVASPANPTGTMLLPQRARRARALVRGATTSSSSRTRSTTASSTRRSTARRASRMARSAWETSREAVVFASFSKYFSMTGWRIGWMLVPDRLRRAVDVLTGNFTICPPVIAQRACLAAFDPASYDELDGHVKRYAGNRRLLLDGLPELGITGLAPADGAFYVYADVGHLTDDTMAFAHDLLARTGVAARAGRRLRHRERPPVRPVQLRRARGRHRGGPGPAVHSRLTRGFPRPVTGHPVSQRSSLGRTDMYGDTEAIRGLARGLRRQADDIRWEADTLLARADAVPWQGLAADAMRCLARYRVGRAEAHRRAARRRRARPRRPRGRGRPGQAADRGDRGPGHVAGRRRPGPDRRAWSAG